MDAQTSVCSDLVWDEHRLKSVPRYSFSDSDLSSNFVVWSVTLGGCTISAVCGRVLQGSVPTAGGGKAEIRARWGGIVDCIVGGMYEGVATYGCDFAPSSKMAANSIRSGPPTKQRIAHSAAKNANRSSIRPGENAAITPNIGTNIAPINISRTPCFTPFLRGEGFFSPVGAGYCGNIPPCARRCMTPSMEKPQREQNRIESVACCWPHLGQNIKGLSVVQNRRHY